MAEKEEFVTKDSENEEENEDEEIDLNDDEC